MELKVWVEGIQRIVCGVTDATTCQVRTNGSVAPLEWSQLIDFSTFLSPSRTHTGCGVRISPWYVLFFFSRCSRRSTRSLLIIFFSCSHWKDGTVHAHRKVAKQFAPFGTDGVAVEGGRRLAFTADDVPISIQMTLFSNFSLLKMLQILNKLGEYSGEVQFILQKSEKSVVVQNTENSSSSSPVVGSSEEKQRQPLEKLKAIK
jgi:hypothetical protein